MIDQVAPSPSVANALEWFSFHWSYLRLSGLSIKDRVGKHNDLHGPVVTGESMRGGILFN